jgi:hypothetical protein
MNSKHWQEMNERAKHLITSKTQTPGPAVGRFGRTAPHATIARHAGVTSQEALESCV